jgi:shikimate kinase
MSGDPKIVYVLVGPKGAGKTHLGRLAERTLGIPFIDVEALARALPEDADRAPYALYEQVECQVELCLRRASEAMLEVTGASPITARLFENLRQSYALRLIQVVAPLETCLARIESRDPSRHLPSTPELIREVHARSIAADFPYDLRLESSRASEADLLAGIQSVREWGARPVADRAPS